MVDRPLLMRSVTAWQDLHAPRRSSRSAKQSANSTQTGGPHAQALRPLTKRGQVQIGNHTFRHVDLLRLTDRLVLSKIDAWIIKTFGVT